MHRRGRSESDVLTLQRHLLNSISVAVHLRPHPLPHFPANHPPPLTTTSPTLTPHISHLIPPLPRRTVLHRSTPPSLSLHTDMPLPPTLTPSHPHSLPLHSSPPSFPHPPPNPHLPSLVQMFNSSTLLGNESSGVGRSPSRSTLPSPDGAEAVSWFIFCERELKSSPPAETQDRGEGPTNSASCWGGWKEGNIIGHRSAQHGAACEVDMFKVKFCKPSVLILHGRSPAG